MNNYTLRKFSTKASQKLKTICESTIKEIKNAGTFKNEKQITSLNLLRLQSIIVKC